MDKILVIEPVYNKKRYRSQCMTNILCQSYCTTEMDIDDGSTNQCVKICEHYINKRSQLEACHITNKGASYARKSEMKNTQGGFVAFGKCLLLHCSAPPSS